MIQNKHNIIMIHGYGGNPENHWFPYIKTEMEQHGIQVFAPQMPGEHTPEKWLEASGEWKDKINENTILIGHSVGATFLLQLIQDLEINIKGAIFVAGAGKPFSIEGGDKTEEDECNAFAKDISWKKIKRNAGEVAIFASTNDVDAPIEVTAHLSASIQSPAQYIEGRGHFTVETFPELLEYLKSQIYLTYDEFKKLDARIGHIKKVEPIEDADKLLRFEIDFGEGGDRQIVSGIREYFPDYESLVGKKALYVLNLEPREIKGVVSYGMLMAVDDLESKPIFLVPEFPEQTNPGSKVR